MDEVHVKGAPECVLHLGPLVVAHQTVVDEDAYELIADGLVDHRGRHRRVDAAREATDDFAVADRGAHCGDRLLDDPIPPTDVRFAHGTLDLSVIGDR